MVLFSYEYRPIQSDLSQSITKNSANIFTHRPPFHQVSGDPVFLYKVFCLFSWSKHLVTWMRVFRNFLFSSPPITTSKISSDSISNVRGLLVAFIYSYIFTVRHSIINRLAFSRRSFTFYTPAEEFVTGISFILHERRSLAQCVKPFVLVTLIAID